MERRKNVIWTNVLVGGLLLATLSACNNDEPAATGTPAPTVAAAPDAAPIPSTIASATPSASTSATPGTSPAETKEKDKPKNNSVASAPKALPATKPLEKGEVKPDRPLPEKDIEPKASEKPKPVQGGLSESNVKAMKTALDDAKKDADAGKIDEAIGKYNEFAGGTWPEAEKDLKTKSAEKHGVMEAAIKVADEAAKSKDKAKFTKAITDLLAAVEKAK